MLLCTGLGLRSDVEVIDGLCMLAVVLCRVYGETFLKCKRKIYLQYGQHKHFY